MDRHALKASISRQINQATGAVGDEISHERGEMFERYMGEPYGDETEDRSAVVSTDIADTIEWIMPELMEIFTSGDKIVSFDPVGPEDEQLAEQETDVVNHIFYVKNDGWMALYSFIKDGLIQKNGYIKRYWSSRDKVSTEEYDGLSIAEWIKMQAGWAEDDYDVEVIRADAVWPEGYDPEMPEIDPMSGMPMPPPEPLVDVEVKLTRTEEKMVVEPVPPEEMLVTPRWNRINLDNVPFVAHRKSEIVSDLIEMGYDPEQVNSLPDADDDEMYEEKIERFATRGSSEYDERESADDSTREVLVHECYIRVDYDGDGKAELRKVMVGGTSYEILRWADSGEDDNEEVETVPFSTWTPVPIPHRHYGRSVAELVADLQRIKTVLFRQMLDNVYLTNNPTREIAEEGIGEYTLADLLHERPGKVVRTALAGQYQEHSPPQFMGQLMPAIEYVDGVRENRTGVTRYNQGLDANSLNKTATGITKLLSASQKKIALFARVCAETGLKHLFQGIHGDLRRNSSKRMTVKLRNEYVEVDPRSWKERSDMTISVGLGTGDKETRMMYLERIIQEQKQHILAGSPLTNVGLLFNAYERFITNAGFKNPEEFFSNPAGRAQQPPQQQRADPAEMLAQVEMAKVEQKREADAAKLQQETAVAQLKVQQDATNARLEDDRERDKMNMEFALRIAEINAKGEAAISMEQIRAAAKVGIAMNQPPNGATQ
jgi:hypothetical protein